jgi:hypothetical protein
MTAQLAAEKPTIKILLYTDEPQISTSEESNQFFALGSMLMRLRAHEPVFAKIRPQLVSRNSDTAHHADNKIDAVLNREVESTGEPFDEIWFFGLHQTSTRDFSLLLGHSGPESELNQDEVSALEQWMKGRAEDGSEGGGILMTGDHANELPSDLLGNPNIPCGNMSAGVSFLSLGRAIGRCVPRAGLLRKWEGPPTSRPIDSFSTLVGPGFQLDRFPQQLVLRNVNLDGDPDPNGQPHPVFFYRGDRFIEVFPDHGHEGAIVIPDTFDESWPTGPNGQTRPHVVAFGRDNRDNKELNIIAAYNGDLAGVGRIVADSTWHHYMNLNLSGFEHPAPLGSPADQIGQFYANLAVWLAPRRKRDAMARAMCWDLARFTRLLEPLANPQGIGEAAHSVLMKVASNCEIHELIQALCPKQFEINVSAAEINSNRQLFLGHVLDLYHQEMSQAVVDNRGKFIGDEIESKQAGMDKLLNSAFARTTDEQAKRFREKAEALSHAVNK